MRSRSMRTLLATAALPIVLAGCGQPAVHTASPAAVKETIEQLCGRTFTGIQNGGPNTNYVGRAIQLTFQCKGNELSATYSANLGLDPNNKVKSEGKPDGLERLCSEESVTVIGPHQIRFACPLQYGGKVIEFTIKFKDKNGDGSVRNLSNSSLILPTEVHLTEGETFIKTP